MPEALQPSTAEQPKGVTLRDAQKRIEKMMNADAQVNPKGTQSRLVDETVGRDPKGRFRAAAQPSDEGDDASEDADTEVAESEEVEADDTPEAEDVDRAQDDDAEGEEATGTADDESQEAKPIQTLAELAEALDISVADLKKQLKHTFNAAGGEVTATLDDLERGYQMEADYQRNKTKLSEERRAFETVAQQQAQKFVADSHVLAQQYNVAEQLLVAEAQHPRMEQLRLSDPGEWTARLTEIQGRIGQLGQARQTAAAHYQNFQQTQLAQTRERELARLAELVPDWGEDKRVTARKTMESIGYSAEEMSNVYDARLIKGALELANLREKVAQYEADKAKAKDTAARIKKEVPKLVKPGKSTTATGTGLQRANVNKLRQRLRKSGSVKDAASIIETML